MPTSVEVGARIARALGWSLTAACTIKPTTSKTVQCFCVGVDSCCVFHALALVVKRRIDTKPLVVSNGDVGRIEEALQPTVATIPNCSQPQTE